MKPCPRCRSQMVVEPYSDPQSRGQRWTCLACGEAIEQAEPNDRRMTPEQIAAAEAPVRRGRPRKVRSCPAS